MHKPWKFSLLGPHDEMPVIRHDAIRQEPNWHLFDGIDKHSLKREVIIRVKEQAFTSDGAVQDVEGGTAHLCQRAMRHNSDGLLSNSGA
jgi:hypothetical protein